MPQPFTVLSKRDKSFLINKTTADICRQISQTTVAWIDGIGLHNYEAELIQISHL
jgi:hypothetical protein